MKRKIKIIVWLGLTVVLVVIAMKAPKVSADEEPVQEPTRSTATVQLTAAQTLALFGQSFNALYYNNGQTQNVTFDFVKSSRTVVDDCAECFSSWQVSGQDFSFVPDGAKNGFSLIATNSQMTAANYQYFDNQLYYNSSWLGVDGGSVIDREKLLGYEFLLYKCNLQTSPVSSSTYDFQFNIWFPFTLSGVDSWKSIFCTQIGTYGGSSAFGDSVKPQITNVNYGTEVRLYGQNPLVPVGVTSDTHLTGYNTRFGVSMHPINTCDYSLYTPDLPTFVHLDQRLSYFGIFSMQIMDESFSTSQDLTGVSWNIRNVDDQYRFQKQGFIHDYTSINDPNDPDYQWDDFACYIMVMCPILEGDYTVGRPSGSGSYIDYTEQIDKLVSGSDATNNKLDIIIQRLDRIYNQMVSDNGGVDLIAPETIGFTQQQKQQILQGASGIDSEFSSITPESFDDEQEAAGSFWEFWDRLIGVFPPKLLLVYTFIMISGAVSWIIYARRG